MQMPFLCSLRRAQRGGALRNRKYCSSRALYKWNCVKGDAYLGGASEGVQVLSQGFEVFRCDALGKFYD